MLHGVGEINGTVQGFGTLMVFRMLLLTAAGLDGRVNRSLLTLY